MSLHVPTQRTAIRADLKIIADMIDPGARVLDIGCGDGALLDHLVHVKQVDGRGVELSQAGVNACVAHGLAVIQGDADADLDFYPDDAFDFAVLSLTLQATRRPKRVLEQMMRIARRAVVSFPNFGHWRVRWQLATKGRMPRTTALGHEWWDTPNIHLCTVTDFIALAQSMRLTVERAVTLDHGGHAVIHRSVGLRANLFGEQAVFLLNRV